MKLRVTSATFFPSSSVDMTPPPDEDGPWEFVSSSVHTVMHRGYLGQHIPSEQSKPGVDSVMLSLVVLWRSTKR